MVLTRRPDRRLVWSKLSWSRLGILCGRSREVRLYYISAPLPSPQKVATTPFFICTCFGFLLLWFNIIYVESLFILLLRRTEIIIYKLTMISNKLQKECMGKPLDRSILVMHEPIKGCLTGSIECCTLSRSIALSKRDAWSFYIHLQYFIFFHFPGACVYSLNLLSYCLSVF